MSLWYPTCSPSNLVDELFSGHEHTEEKGNREKSLGKVTLNVIVRQSRVGEAGTLSVWKGGEAESFVHTGGKGAVEGGTSLEEMAQPCWTCHWDQRRGGGQENKVRKLWLCEWEWGLGFKSRRRWWRACDWGSLKSWLSTPLWAGEGQRQEEGRSRCWWQQRECSAPQLLD